MTIPLLTAAELFDVVKEHKEVWEKHLRYTAAGFYWSEPVPCKHAELILLALFTLAAECGVRQNESGGWITHGWRVPMEASDHPLRAAVAAYKKGRANGL
jgi:hypothetical protein